ncbi:MAG: TlpA family protein disulfide reductase [Deltaproteobacteria bacterium]|nr:MAG: TlpA family protein disulfide reductase [Deltaproteobacteria bacterium]
MKMRAIAVTLAIAAAVAFSTPPSLAQESRESTFTKIPTVKGIETLKPGTKAPDFKVQDLEGKEFHLASCCGKDAVLLFFWSFFCGPCREEIPMINQVAREYQGKGLQVLGVNLDGREMKKAIDKFVVNEKISFRILFDELAGDAFRVADPYGVAGTPALFLIDRNGVVAFGVVGAVTPEQLKAEIGKVLK